MLVATGFHFFSCEMTYVAEYDASDMDIITTTITNIADTTPVHGDVLAREATSGEPEQRETNRRRSIDGSLVFSFRTRNQEENPPAIKGAGEGENVPIGTATPTKTYDSDDAKTETSSRDHTRKFSSPEEAALFASFHLASYEPGECIKGENCKHCESLRKRMLDIDTTDRDEISTTITTTTTSTSTCAACIISNPTATTSTHKTKVPTDTEQQIRKRIRRELLDIFWPHARFRHFGSTTPPSGTAVSSLSSFLYDIGHITAATFQHIAIRLSRAWNYPGRQPYWLLSGGDPLSLLCATHSNLHNGSGRGEATHSNRDDDSGGAVALTSTTGASNAILAVDECEVLAVAAPDLVIIRRATLSPNRAPRNVAKHRRRLDEQGDVLLDVHMKQHARLVERLSRAMSPQIRKNSLGKMLEALETYASKYNLDVRSIKSYYLIDDALREEQAEMPHMKEPPAAHRPLLDMAMGPLRALESGWWDRDWTSMNGDDVSKHAMQLELAITDYLWGSADGRRLVSMAEEEDQKATGLKSTESSQIFHQELWDRLQSRLDQAFLFDPAIDTTSGTPNNGLSASEEIRRRSVYQARRRAGDTYRKVVNSWKRCLRSRLHVRRIAKEGVAAAAADEEAELPEMDGQVAVVVAQDSVHLRDHCPCGLFMQQCYVASMGTLSAFLITSHSVPALVTRPSDYAPVSGDDVDVAMKVHAELPDDVMAVNLEDHICADTACDDDITSLTCTRRGRWVAALSAETGRVTVYEMVVKKDQPARLIRMARTETPFLAATCLAFDLSIAEPLSEGDEKEEEEESSAMPTLWVATRFGLALGFEQGKPDTFANLVCRRFVWSGYPLPITQLDVFGRRLSMLNDFGLVVHETPCPSGVLRLFHECQGDSDLDQGRNAPDDHTSLPIMWASTTHQLRFIPHTVSFAIQDEHGIAMHRNGALISFRLGRTDGDSGPPPLTFLQRALRVAHGGESATKPAPDLPYQFSMAPTDMALKRPLIAFAQHQDGFCLVHPGTFWAAGIHLETKEELKKEEKNQEQEQEKKQ